MSYLCLCHSFSVLFFWMNRKEKFTSKDPMSLTTRCFSRGQRIFMTSLKYTSVFLFGFVANSLILCFLVSRIEAVSEQQSLFMQLDVNTDIYRLRVGDKINLVLAATLNLDGTPDSGYYTQVILRFISANDILSACL